MQHGCVYRDVLLSEAAWRANQEGKVGVFMLRRFSLKIDEKNSSLSPCLVSSIQPPGHILRIRSDIHHPTVTSSSHCEGEAR